jgi:hypothetical protein
MKIFALEHAPASYFADFVVYPAAILASLAALLAYNPATHWPGLAAACIAGLAVWTFMEYMLHRYVLHGLQPFKGWHEEHHQRPFALIGTSTLASFSLFAVLVFLPLCLAIGKWPALASTMGVVAGYLVYVTVHHGTHHWKARHGSWMWARKQAHARHHRAGDHGWYGVTTCFWDKVFASMKK